MYGGDAGPRIQWSHGFEPRWIQVSETISRSLGPPLLCLLPGLRPASTLESQTGSDSGWSPANCRSTEPAGICGRRKMGKVPQGGSARDPGPKFLYSVLGRRRVHAPPVIRTAGARQPPEAQHPTEADSVPPGFARIHWKTPEEQEAARYETPANSKQSINEELGIQNVTNITEDWYARSELELASAVKKCSPTNGSGWTPRRTTSSDVRRGSLWCAGARPGIWLPGHSHRRPGPRYTWRILQSSRGWKTNHWIRGWLSSRRITGCSHRGIDAQKTVDSEEDRGSEVSQMKIEDQEVWFLCNSSKCF